MENSHNNQQSILPIIQSRPHLLQNYNQHLTTAIQNDYLYHLSLSKKDAFNFSEIKFVCIGGSNDRMKTFAHQLAVQMCQSDDGTTKNEDLLPVERVGDDKRFVLFKVSNRVLVCSHGMGGPSISILLNEVAKLLHYAKAANVLWLRIGSSGGLGVEPGTVIITEESLDGALNPYHETLVLGKTVKRRAVFDKNVCQRLLTLATDELHYPAIIAKTMCCNDFYEGQGRLDGAICEYTVNDKMKFLQRAYKNNVRNMEMESLQFGAFTNHIGIKAATVCAVFLDRLKGDQVSATKDELKEYEQRAIAIVLKFIQQTLAEEEEEEEG